MIAREERGWLLRHQGSERHCRVGPDGDLWINRVYGKFIREDYQRPKAPNLKLVSSE